MISSITKQVRGAIAIGALLISGSSFAQTLKWGELGPNDVAGRSRSIIVDNTSPSGNKLFAAGVSGGVFRTSDGGSNWTPVNDQAASLIVSCMGQDAAGNVYFGTGESFGRGGDGAGSSGFIGNGFYKILANSNTINLLQDSSVFGNVNEIAVAPTNTIYVAADKGFFISTDGGVSFTEEANSITAGVGAMDVKIAKNGDIYYSAGAKTSSTSAVYYSAFGSSLYTAITPTVITNRGRIEIATSPVDANYVYLSIAKQKTSASASGGLSAVMISDTKGVSWSVISIGTAQFDPFISLTNGAGYGDYANTIVADPQKKDACYLGSEVFYGWNQITGNNLGQGTWYQIGTSFNVPFAIFIHAKIHDVKFDAATNVMYIATDGGIFKSTPGYSGFLPFNKGFNVSQFNTVTAPIYPRTTVNNNTLTPYAGAAGGRVGNSLTYLPGFFTNGPMTSTSFGSSDGYQADFSKIIPKAVIYSGASGAIFRTNDIDAAPHGTFYDISYKNGGAGGPGSATFANENTPMRLWENTFKNGDSAIYLNEPSFAFINNNSATQTKFAITNILGQRDHRYEKVIITTSTTNTLSPPPDQTITIVPVYNGPKKIVSHVVTGNANTSSVLNNRISLTTFSAVPADSIYFEFTTAPGISSKITVRTELSFQATDNGVTSTIGTNKSATTQTFGIASSIRPKKKYHYSNILVSMVSTKSVSPLPTQTINIAIAPYTSNSIPLINQTATGFGTAAIYLNNTTLKDSLFISTIAAPDSCRFDVSCDYITYDSIIVKNTDVSGYNFETGQLMTGYLSTSVTPIPITKLPLTHSARLATGISQTVTTTGPSIYAVKRALNFSINPDWVKIAGKQSRPDEAGGVASSTTVAMPIKGTTVTRLEWSQAGNYIYFSTKLNDTTFYLYRISHLEFIGDSAAADYSGAYSSDVDSTSTLARKSVRQRTTPIGMFKYPITGIAVADNDTMLMITCGGYKNKTGNVYYSNSNVKKLDMNFTDASYFSVKNGNLPFMPAYTGIFEMSDNKTALVGTESGVWSTTDITAGSPVWVKEIGTTGNFPNVPVFQLRQQTYPHWLCYNSGVIYASTHGRGIWSTDSNIKPYGIGIEEQEQAEVATGTSIRLYPNPAADLTNVVFKANGEESYKITVYDINGRVMIQEATGKLVEGAHMITLSTSTLTSGVYFVTVNGSANFNANSKLVITH